MSALLDMDAALRQATPFGKYVLLERVSVGGMAEVFKAKAFGVEGFEKILAIKRILPSMAEDADFIEMFIDEAKICGQLNHTNICQIYELGRVADSHFIAMEYVWGKDVLQMQNRFRKMRQKMTPEMAAYITCRICEGLDYAHKKKDAVGKSLGIIHRDISPQNILVSYEGELKVIDFGIAKAASRSSKTQAGVLKGKFGYMSPEQVRGLPLDRRSDIFAIGTILYELLTAERLFHGDSDFETLEKVRNVDVAAPTTVNPGIPKVLEKIIMRALSKDTETRYQWASEMAEDLNTFLLGHDPAFSAQNLSQWMREQFAVEMRRERLVLDEQQKVTREVLLPVPESSLPRPLQKSAPKLPATAPTAPLRAHQAHVDDGDEDGFDEKTTVSGPEFDHGGPDRGSLPEQSTRIIDSGSPTPGNELPAQQTVLFNDQASGQAKMPDAMPFNSAVGDPSMLYPPPAPSYTPHYGQLMPPGPGTGSARASVWKDILIGVVVAAVVVGGILGARKYLAARGQATLAIVSASGGGGEVLLDGVARGQLAPGAPLTLKGLPAGEHTIVVHGGSAGEFKQSVALAAGDVSVISVSFVSAGGETGKVKLEIEAPGPGGTYTPVTADVYVDGALLSTEASSTPISLGVGSVHEVRVQKQGMSDQRFNVETKAGETVVRPVRLVAAAGKISIVTEPPGADVTVNGKKAGVTPTSVGDLDIQQKARVSFRLSGYQAVTKTVSFESGAEQSLDVRLVLGKETREPEGDVAPKVDRTKEKNDKEKADKGDKGDKNLGTVVKNPTTATTTTPVKAGKTGSTGTKPSLPSGDGIAAVNFGDSPSSSENEPGYLIANTVPFARVFVDGKDTGKSTPIAPRSKLELKPGKHVITFVVGGKKFPNEITIKPGEEFRLIRQLEVATP